MDGVIIIDEKQLVIKDVEGIMTSWSGKQFTIRFDTVKKEFHDDLTDDELLSRIVNEMPSAPLEAQPGMAGAVPITLDTTAEAVPEALKMRTAAGSPAAKEITLQMGNTRSTIEPSRTRGTRATFGSAISGVSRAQAQAQEEQLSPDAPSSHGIILPDKDMVLAGKKFPMDVDQVHILNKLRRDLGVQLIYESDTMKYKNLKTNVAVQSEQFSSMDETSIRVALQTLVASEQNVTRGRDRENLLFLDSKPVLVVETVVDETAGRGVFHFEELTSVYENPVTYRTKVDNGKD